MGRWGIHPDDVAGVVRGIARGAGAVRDRYLQNREVQTGAQDAVTGEGGVLASGIPDEEP